MNRFARKLTKINEETPAFLKKEELPQNRKLRIEKIEKITAKYGPVLLGSVEVGGRRRKIFLPKRYIDLFSNDTELKEYNDQVDEQKFFLIWDGVRLQIDSS
jgi:hypothetical protein